MAMRLGIIAGGGDLPRQVIEHCLTESIPFHVLQLAGQATDACLATYPHTVVRLGSGRQIYNALRQNNITDVVMIGSVRRPTLFSLWPDWFVIKLLPRLGLAALGDDGLLRNVIKIIEGYGFSVRGVHEFLPQLLAPDGVLTTTAPDAATQHDIALGIEEALVHGSADIGQAVVVRGGRIIAKEDRTGTDAMLLRVKQGQGSGGVMVKLCKPQQDQRIDLPTIGVRTVKNAAAAGLRGIAVSAGRTLINNRASTVAEADRHGMFIIGVDA